MSTVRAIRPDAQAFDEVRIVTVPRYKTSDFSGNEWRIGARVQLIRKGRVIVEQDFSAVEYACKDLASIYNTAVANGKGVLEGEGELCDQEGCSQVATVTYRKKADYDNMANKTELGNIMKVRKFCDRHKCRGNAGYDDGDANYSKL